MKNVCDQLEIAKVMKCKIHLNKMDRASSVCKVVLVQKQSMAHGIAVRRSETNRIESHIAANYFATPT